MSAKTKSERLKRLLSHGYFAPELPPCFVSGDLARYRRSILAGIDALPANSAGTRLLRLHLPNRHGFIFRALAKTIAGTGFRTPLPTYCCQES